MQNGNIERALPTLEIRWDADKQGVELHFKSDEIKTWEMVLALLDMAKRDATFKLDLARAASMQQAMVAQQQQSSLAQQLRRLK